MDSRTAFTVLSIMLFVGCTSGPVCNKPYILVGQSCCLDQDDNKICDKDQAKTTTTIPRFSPIPGIRPSCSGFTYIAPADLDNGFSVQKDGVGMNLSNNAPQTLTIEYINASMNGDVCSPVKVNQTLKEAERLGLSLTNCPLPQDGSNYYSIDLVILYTNPETKARGLSLGECHGPMRKEN